MSTAVPCRAMNHHKCPSAWEHLNQWGQSWRSSGSNLSLEESSPSPRGDRWVWFFFTLRQYYIFSFFINVTVGRHKWKYPLTASTPDMRKTNSLCTWQLNSCWWTRSFMIKFISRVLVHCGDHVFSILCLYHIQFDLGSTSAIAAVSCNLLRTCSHDCSVPKCSLVQWNCAFASQRFPSSLKFVAEHYN